MDNVIKFEGIKLGHTSIELRSLIANLEDDMQFLGGTAEDMQRLMQYRRELAYIESHSQSA